jgi:hypothetical protein
MVVTGMVMDMVTAMLITAMVTAMVTGMVTGMVTVVGGMVIGMGMASDRAGAGHHMATSGFVTDAFFKRGACQSERPITFAAAWSESGDVARNTPRLVHRKHRPSE